LEHALAVRTSTALAYEHRYFLLDQTRLGLLQGVCCPPQELRITSPNSTTEGAAGVSAEVHVMAAGVE